MMMKLVRLLVVGMMFVVLYSLAGPALQAEVPKLIGAVNPDAGQAFTLITQTGENWTNISRTISDALNSSAK
jgi:cytochrome oxidase Cu insertion factor (SCO1/SenC/PrrC family)